MIRIATSVEAFEAIASTLPFGSVGYENQINECGERLIWLDHAVVARLRGSAATAKATAMSSSGWWLKPGTPLRRS